MTVMFKRRKNRPDHAEHEGRGPVERLLFSFMGPPQLGDPNEPVRKPTRVDSCTLCGQPWDDHEIVRLATHSYTRCPAS